MWLMVRLEWLWVSFVNKDWGGLWVVFRRTVWAWLGIVGWDVI